MTEPLPLTRPRTRSRERLGPSPADSLIPSPAPPASDTARRVIRLLLLRTLVVTAVLGLSLWILATAEQVPPSAVWLQSGIIAATYVTSIAFGVMLRRGFPPRQVARPMQAADLAVTSLLVYATGGVESPYIFLYALSIVGAGALSYRGGAVAVTLASITLLIGVSLLAWTQAIALPALSQVRPWEQSGVDLIRTLGINLAALVGVGALSFIFGDQLQRGAETLATTRKAAADLLTLHEDIVRSLASGLITIAPDGIILTANVAAADILGQPPALAGQPVDKLMPGLSALIATGHGELRRADLKLAADLTIGVTVSPLRDVKNQVIGRVVNFQDLTELRRLEAQSRRSERLAMVGQLAAGIAHEIRNPLASISGSIELLRQGPSPSDDDRTLMAIVHREIQRLNVLIGDLLDYANPRPPQPVDFDLGVMVEETLHVARGEQAFAAVEMALGVDRPLPLHADPAKLRQVLWNLLRNAADAATLGGRHVRVDARRGPDATTIVVADDGPGIAADQLARIFDPFYTTKSKGTGLGLATCHAIVAEHGGHIDVASEPGTGTRMTVSLPRAR
ncbi:MAG TPA: ATP-binding protein [Kofleriaceae bacterium]|jgi:two-component system sensor histidine kinase PilS (NtrC family)|nr:ATP-binding protein [Kofleriaceae bacterium]